MVKAVYDTNIIVSALIGRGFPFTALLFVLTGKHPTCYYGESIPRIRKSSKAP